MSPVFSVIIPVFNRASTILPTLKSVQAQTYHDFECIIVDDGSDDADDLRAALASLKDSRFRIERKTKGGASSSRNRGLREARGRYVAFLDSDDLFLPEKLGEDAKILTNSDARTVVFAPMLVDRGDGLLSRRPRRGPLRDEHISDYLARAEGWVPSSTIALHRDFAKAVLYAENVSYGDDTDFALRLFEQHARFHMHPRPLAVMNDRLCAGRLSLRGDYDATATWLEKARAFMTTRAYHAYRGRHLARMAARAGMWTQAGRIYGKALATGSFSPKLAVKALLQILLPLPLQRRLAALKIRALARLPMW